MEETMHTFNRFFFTFGRFPAINNLAIIPTVEVPSFVKSSDIISHSELKKKFNSGGMRGLVCVQFLAALNIHLGGDKTISKDAMSKFLHNLSMQALGKSGNSILLKFDAINKLNKSINSLLVNKMLTFENAEIEILQNFFDPLTLVGDELTINDKIKNTIVKEVLKDEKPPSDVDDSNNPMAKMTEEIEQDNIIQNRLFLETELKKDERDFETGNNLVEEGTRQLIQTITNPDYEATFNDIININDWTNNIKEDQDLREPKLDRHTQQNFNAVVVAMIPENNANILPRMLAKNEIRDSLTLEKIIELQEDQNKQLAAKIKLKLDVYLHSDDNGNNNGTSGYVYSKYRDLRICI